MHRGIAREIEHRRGLVLGLTLAEALLLLLFLLLLALGAEFIELEKQVQDAAAERRAIINRARDIETGSLQDLEDPKQLKDIAAKLQASNVLLEATNAKLSSQLREITAHSGDPDRLIRLAKEAVALNPDDPPAVLERGLEWVKAVGLTADLPANGSSQSPDGKHSWPPIIRLSEAEGYYFDSGSAELSLNFKNALQHPIINRLLEIVKEYDVNVIEVIGHTDEQPLVLRSSNLDRTTSAYLQGSSQEQLVPADNAGLGFARAVSVVRVLSSDPRLGRFSILPLSGAQVVDIGDRLSMSESPAPAEARRRIEIRVRRSDVIADAAPDPKPAGSQIAAVSRPAQVKPIVGQPFVVDADTIEIGKFRIRLWGVDAIESRQSCSMGGQAWDCAAESKSKLASFVDGETLSCQPLSTDPFGRIVAKCSVAGTDLGAWLVSSGYAMDYPEYSSGEYAQQQALAKSARLGIWRGTFTPPWTWRRTQKKEGASAR